MIKAVLTDIEGTITSLSFVKNILFPYSKNKISEFIWNHFETDERIIPIIDNVLIEAGQSTTEKLKIDRAIDILLQWIAEDKKATPLKELQGIIWEEGYKEGDYTGHLYPDAYDKLKELKEKGFQLYVYSSGSVKAQELLFQHSDFGDIRDLFSGFFDTKIGPKQEAESYSKIAKELNLPPNEILFLSDIEGELIAANQAGMQTTQLLRKEDYPLKELPKNISRSILNSFEGLYLESVK